MGVQVGGDPALLERCAALLSAEELAECHSTQEAPVVRERLLARALVRSVLAQYAAGGPAPGALRFERGVAGKPALLWPRHTASGSRLQFNLTHTGSLIGGHRWWVGGPAPGPLAQRVCGSAL